MISRKGQFDPKEVALINRYVKKRDGQMAERRESIRRASLDLEAIATADRRALAELYLEENSQEEVKRPSTGSTTPDVVTGVAPPLSDAHSPTRGGKGGTAREVCCCAQPVLAHSEGTLGLKSLPLI